MQEDRNLFKPDFKAESAWSIISGNRESGPGAFADFNSWKALANSFGEKFSEIGTENWDRFRVVNFLFHYSIKYRFDQVSF